MLRGSQFLLLTLRAIPEVGWRGSEMQHFLEPELEGLEEVQFQGPDLELGSTISCLCVGSEGSREQHHVLWPLGQVKEQRLVSAKNVPEDWQPSCSRRHTGPCHSVSCRPICQSSLLKVCITPRPAPARSFRAETPKPLLRHHPRGPPWPRAGSWCFWGACTAGPACRLPPECSLTLPRPPARPGLFCTLDSPEIC